MFHLILSDIDSHRCRVFDDETLDYIWEKNDTITKYIRTIGDVGNLAFCDSVRSNENRLLRYNYLDNVEKKGAKVTNFCGCCTFTNIIGSVYGIGKLHCNQDKQCMFELASIHDMVVIFQNNLFDFCIKDDIKINGVTFYIKEHNCMIHGIGIDEHGRFVVTVKTKRYSHTFSMNTFDIIISKDGSISSRKLGLKKGMSTNIAIHGDFCSLKRRMLLKGV